LEARTIELEWKESFEAHGRPVLEFAVTRVQFRPGGWSVGGAVTNRSTVGFSIVAPSGIPALLGRKQNWTWFGLAWMTKRQDVRIVHAETYRPAALPKILAPGETWSGTFGGPVFAARRRTIRVTFGMFVARKTPPPGVPAQVGWVIDHSFQG
jgi:hypothetical protein